MKQYVTKGIVLARTDYGEADRILTVLTPDHGKLRLMAKGVRKVKSKLAGGIELFSISTITFIPGRKEIGTLVSTRLDRHFGSIVHDITRTMLAYGLLKRLHKATEDEPGEEYFALLSQTLVALESALTPEIIEAWFDAQLLQLAGHQPDLSTDVAGQRLDAEALYQFDFDAMRFAQNKRGPFEAAHIKLLRLLFDLRDPTKLQNIQDTQTVLLPVKQLIATARGLFIQS